MVFRNSGLLCFAHIGTGNTDETYEMQGLDIKNFVGKVLQWSNVIEVLDYEEYVVEYKAENTI